ncbi:hypothetical protein ACJBUE_21565 (plasmid) [Ralstonia syzygii subsp. celebesensis]|uniref:hypothetical protein n=1 Tax=Ralstonia syzygii TaxID=28097 RepID=UPI00387E0AAA
MGCRIGFVLAMSAWSAVACTPAIIGPSYTMDVRLADGKPVQLRGQPAHDVTGHIGTADHA